MGKLQLISPHTDKKGKKPRNVERIYILRTLWDVLLLIKNGAKMPCAYKDPKKRGSCGCC
ncbi:Uncharacterized protein OBRU01_04764 [Operophtera brumata]|uniref:Uncharacterized protein n=1 Tax=Operophtera brumata TaxID=104452 RepID=A0A0L7LNL1_OPEBR|nr:Uncharacterized protein OBRU01_04764 [Operophtera brumata]